MINEEIRDTILQDENMLKIKKVQLTRQINTLEEDIQKLMKQLRHNAYQMG